MWVIKDWADNTLFKGRTFDTFEDAWSYLYEVDPIPSNDLEAHWYDDYYVEQLTKRGD